MMRDVWKEFVRGDQVAGDWGKPLDPEVDAEMDERASML